MKRNSISLKQLRGFVAVADTGSFVASAAMLGLSQPALSQSIRQLEEQIGGAVFHRTTRRVKLTALGEKFLISARALLRQFDVAVSEIQDFAKPKSHRVVVAGLPSVAYRLMPLVIAINEQLNPGIRVAVWDGNRKSIISAITSGEADLAIGSFSVPDPNLDSVVLGRDRFHAVFPRDHPLHALKTVRWTDLQGHAFITMTHETGIREIVDNAVAPYNIKLNTVSEVSNLATVNGLIEERIGISALPGLALPRHDHPFIVSRELREPTLERTIRIAWRKGIGLSPAAWSLMGAISETVRKLQHTGFAGNVEWNRDFLDRHKHAQVGQRAAALAPTK
jgi:DNA-binding transcriptional LysR family regulator